MKGRWSVPRIMAATGTVTLIVGGVGFLLASVLNAFDESGHDDLHWVFIAMFGVGMLDIIMSRVLKRIQDRRPPAAAPPVTPVAPAAPVDPYTPSEDGVRLEQLKTITGLRDSGALTAQEFEAEKRRILRGDAV